VNNLRGILLMVASMAGFAIEDAFVKAAAATVPVGQILVVLGLGGAAVFGTLARLQGTRLLSPAVLLRPVILRNLSEMMATMTFVSAIALAPLSTVSAILQATPLAVTLGAAVILRAKVGWRRWTAILVGFAGVLVIVRPNAEVDLGAIFAVVSVIFLAARDLATRAIPSSVPSTLIATYGFASIVVPGALLTLLGGGVVVPDPPAALALAGALTIGVFAYYAIVAAMRVGDIAVVTPFRYTRLLFAVAIGVIVFGERPDAATLAGAGIVIASGLYTILREAHLARAERALSSRRPAR
jgi:drug/metabolite transporter (DMT)-like permease